MAAITPIATSTTAINLSRQLWRLQHLPLWYYLQ
jgi:hypothetical protein